MRGGGKSGRVEARAGGRARGGGRGSRVEGRGIEGRGSRVEDPVLYPRNIETGKGF